MSKTIRPSVFVGSSSEGLDIARAIHAHLSEVAQVTVWKDNVFPLNKSPLEALFEALDRFDFAVLVLTPDDVRTTRHRKHLSPRDNVLFELGLFWGHLGKSRTFVVKHPDAEVPSDLAGVTVANVERRDDENTLAAVGPACTLIKGEIRPTRKEPLPRLGLDVGVYRNVEDFDFLGKISELIEKSSEITFVGTGLTVLYQADIRTLIARRAKGGLKATICFGNPFSPYVRNRLIEEERCAVRPEVAAEGIINRVQAMLQMAERVPHVEVKLFNNYPTMSIFRFDDHQFVSYPMGYRKLGNQCPALFVQKPGAYADFLDEMIKNYLEDSVDAREVFRVKVDGRRTMDWVVRERIRAVAVYAVPDPRSDFYQHGSELLGYDLVTGREKGGGADVDHFHRFVGRSKTYGFHVTVADVMYMEVNQIPALIQELRAIASSIHGFDLQVDAVSDCEFGEHSIALRCNEASGRLERLLGEVTVRIRPLALGTNYTLDRSDTRLYGPLTPCEETMLEAYQSPYVLSRFHPHFTLTMPPAAPPTEDRRRMFETIGERFGVYLEGKKKVRIDRLYVLERPLDSEYWDPVRDENTVWLR